MELWANVGMSINQRTFYYGGSFRTHTYLMPNGEKLHIRSANDLLRQNQVLDNKNKRFGEGIKKRIRFSFDFYGG